MPRIFAADLELRNDVDQTVSHGLNTMDVIVQVYQTGQTWEPYQIPFEVLNSADINFKTRQVKPDRHLRVVIIS